MEHGASQQGCVSSQWEPDEKQASVHLWFWHTREQHIPGKDGHSDPVGAHAVTSGLSAASVAASSSSTTRPQAQMAQTMSIMRGTCHHRRLRRGSHILQDGYNTRGSSTARKTATATHFGMDACGSSQRVHGREPSVPSSPRVVARKTNGISASHFSPSNLLIPARNSGARVAVSRGFGTVRKSATTLSPRWEWHRSAKARCADFRCRTTLRGRYWSKQSYLPVSGIGDFPS